MIIPNVIGVNPLQTTLLELGIVSGRVALLLRSAEIQPVFDRFVTDIQRLSIPPPPDKNTGPIHTKSLSHSSTPTKSIPLILHSYHYSTTISQRFTQPKKLMWHFHYTPWQLRNPKAAQVLWGQQGKGDGICPAFLS